MSKILEIVGDLDSLVRDEYAEGRIGYESYIKLTDILKKINKKLHSESDDIIIMNNDAKTKLEYIQGAGFRWDFPKSQPSSEWVGAVIDFLEETNN